MDGLLIDSEPLWEEAGSETLKEFGKVLTPKQYSSSTGLRTEEWISHWFRFFDISMQHVTAATNTIIQKAIDKIAAKAEPMAGVDYILHFFRENNFQIALASSSPMELIDVVVDKLNIRSQFHVLTSAQHLAFGKPHPEVFLNFDNVLGKFTTVIIFFFSSRGRNTRSDRDWSSDVCSSDLVCSISTGSIFSNCKSYFWFNKLWSCLRPHK